MTKSFTTNTEAYQDYLKGRYWWNKRTKEGLNKATDFFQQAIAKDHTYALAYSGLADGYSQLAVLGFVSPKEAFPSAKEAAQKALELDETLAEAHTSLAIIKAAYDWDWSGAEREFQRAIELNPNYADAHLIHGAALRAMGKIEQAAAEDKRALELDPFSLPANGFLGLTFYEARQYDQAIEQEKKTLELEPNLTLAHNILGLAYVQKSMYKEGIAEFEKSLVISPADTMALSWLGHSYGVAGRRSEAQTVLDQLDALSEHKYVSAGARAIIYAGLGEKDKAFDWLEKAYEERSIADIQAVPDYDPLRSDPRWTDLLRRMNLRP